MGAKSAITAENILDAHHPEVKAITQKLRQIITNAIPEAIERPYPGWHGIGYRHPKAGYVCCIFPLDDMVKLAFEHGAFLPDPDNLLKVPPTSGKQVRYVELVTVGNIPEDEIVSLLHAAIRLRL